MNNVNPEKFANNLKQPARFIIGAFLVALLAFSGSVWAKTAEHHNQSVEKEIQALQNQIDALQDRLDALKQRLSEKEGKPESRNVAPASGVATNKSKLSADKIGKAKTAQTASHDNAGKKIAKNKATENEDEVGITLGGAVRFQYSYEGYDNNNVERLGDMDFDIFRLDLHGTVHDIILDAQWRWFLYMSALHHAWVGYNFDKQSQIKLGLTRIPFGNLPYNSHNYFFSSNYYLGLEDSYSMGVEYVFAGDPWNLQLAFFKNAGMGGVDGSVRDRSHSYTYNIVGVRQPGEGTYARPKHPAGTYNTLAARLARTFTPGGGWNIELGVSGLYGNLRDIDSKIGDYYAWALHANIDYGRWNFQAQLTHYDYNTASGAYRMAIAAYAYYDSIAAEADSYTLNVAYHLPVNWGPIEALDFYNDYSLVTHKSGGLPHTFMNVLGVGLSAGDLYIYFDYVRARNQPFIGGSMAGHGEVEQRLNVNFGFYF